MIDKVNATAINSIMSQIRQYEARAKGDVEGIAGQLPGLGSPAETKAPAASGFGDLVKGAIQSVNKVQNHAAELSNAFDRGEDVPLTEVVLAMQKSSLAFETTLQIRNKVMKAYEDIRSMPL